MAKAKGKKRQRKAVDVANYIRPTAEREAANDFRSAGAAVRVVPVIDQLRTREVLSEQEWVALSYYRDQASLADKSPTRSCCDFSPRGGSGPGVAIVSASIETERMERGMGLLRHLCRAIVVYDMTIEDWCMAEYGSARGSNPPSADPGHIGITAMELKYAAGSIVPRR